MNNKIKFLCGKKDIAKNNYEQEVKINLLNYKYFTNFNGKNNTFHNIKTKKIVKNKKKNKKTKNKKKLNNIIFYKNYDYSIKFPIFNEGKTFNNFNFLELYSSLNRDEDIETTNEELNLSIDRCVFDLFYGRDKNKINNKLINNDYCNIKKLSLCKNNDLEIKEFFTFN